MDQMTYQKSVIWDEYIAESDIDVRAREILRVWQRKGVYHVGQKQGRGHRKSAAHRLFSRYGSIA
ncbi:hypothetical protein [Geobacillus thermodenitrificans]|uniref:hypothetical protein n=1 Tax=Geobacillus thermodenitrificans TaxID=33940 RepID=UPI002E24B9AB|nr:hypothetical protein [Geobacillus thermodenitrificans]